MMKKNEGMLEHCQRVCAYVQLRSQPLPGGFQNKAPRVFFQPHFKAPFWRIQTAIPPKSYICGILSVKSHRVQGNLKKKRKEKKIAMWPLYGRLYDRAKTDQT